MRIALSILMLLLCVGVVSAALPSRIVAENCTFGNVTNVACGDTVTASCWVSVIGNLSPDTGISGVNFNIGGQTFPATCANCNSNWVGNWTVSIPVTRSYLDLISNVSLTSVTATTADGTGSCSYSPAYSLAAGQTYGPVSFGSGGANFGCYGSFKGATYVTNTCNCTYTQTTGVVQSDNSVLMTFTPSAGCSNQSVRVETGFADFCDPGYIAQAGGCSNSLSNDSDILAGFMSKTYTMSNSNCQVQSTAISWFNHQTGSDLMYPIDSGMTTIPCKLDVVTGEAREATKQSSGIRFSDFGKDNTSYAIGGSATYQPLLWDLDGDGISEVVSFGSSLIDVRSNRLAEKSSISVGGGVIEGQPSFWGVDDYGGTSSQPENIVLQPSVLASGRPLLVVPVKEGANTAIQVYSFSATGVPSLTRNDSIGAKDASGITCYKTACFFAVSGSTGVYRYDPVGGSLLASSGFPASTGVVAGTSPVIIPGNMGAVDYDRFAFVARNGSDANTLYQVYIMNATALEFQGVYNLAYPPNVCFDLGCAPMGWYVWRHAR